MTKTHFEAIATIITTNRLAAVDADSIEGLNYVYSTALDLSEYFANVNPRFNRELFLTACGF